jgi:hypothetical protein
MDNLSTQKVANAPYVFDNWFVDTKKAYLYYFQAIPSISSVSGIAGEKLYKAIKERFSTLIVGDFQHREYALKQRQFEFGRTILLLNNRCLLELDDNYCEVYHNGEQAGFIADVVTLAQTFKGRQKRKPLEINLITQGRNGFELKEMEIKRTKLAVDLFYEDDFKPVDELIRRRLNQKKDKGIVLLHGLPGTGKTSYLRYLVGKIRKRILFLSPDLAANLMNPGFIDLLVDNPDSVVIIEDAEKIIMDRKSTHDSSVSNLLNISDGLLADFLNVQLICTFNSELTLIDGALLRKGRLIAQYEFGKLGVGKAQRLSDHLGFRQAINRPMTVAEISNQRETGYPRTEKRMIGFRREAMEN